MLNDYLKKMYKQIIIKQKNINFIMLLLKNKKDS